MKSSKAKGHDKPKFEVITTGDGRNQIRARVGNADWTATQRADGRWELEQVTPGPFVCGLEQDLAEHALEMLQVIYASLKREPSRPAPRAVCPDCDRSIALLQGAFAWHNEQEPGPGVESVRCKGIGKKIDLGLAPAGAGSGAESSR